LKYERIALINLLQLATFVTFRSSGYNNGKRQYREF